MSAPFRGQDGAVAFGGIVAGSPQTQGTVALAATAATFDGGGAALTGTLIPGDTFTVAGDAQVYTVVTGGAIGETTANELAITFTPGVQIAGGWADNAAVTVSSNSVARIREWSLSVPRDKLDASVMGSASKAYLLGQKDWTAQVKALFDYDDPEQAAFIDRGLTNSPTALGLSLVVETGKQFWAAGALAGGVSVTGDRGALVEAMFDVQGSGDLAIDWT